MKRKLIHYLTALLVLSACATVYREAANRLLRAPEVAIVIPRPPTSKAGLKDSLADLFPAGAWQLGDCKRLLTGNGALLFQNWHQTSEDHWKLEPITIVVGRGLESDGSDAPIVLTAEEGAEVQFAESLDVMGGSAPPIKMGRMIGEVRIKRFGDAKPGENLDVTTGNVRIDNRKVWTTEQIIMQVGGASMRGRDLTIHLAASANRAASNSAPSSILDRMELVYLDELKIPLDPPERAATQPRRIGPSKSPRRNGVVTIHCDNGLVYDFALDQLSLRKAIRMVRTGGGPKPDTFRCETLDLVLRDPADRSMKRNGPLDWIDRVNATGLPAIVDLPSQQFRLAAEEIDFDALGGLLRAGGNQPVAIKRGVITASLTQLAYQFDPKLPEQIGTVDARGLGEVSVADPGVAIRRFKWRDGFRLQPLDDTTLKSIQGKQQSSRLGLRVDGQVQATLADGGEFKAGAIEGVLVADSRPLSDEKPPATSLTSRPALQQPADRSRPRFTFRPEVFHATDSVDIESSAIAMQTNQLSLYFEQAAAPVGSGTRARSPDSASGVSDWVIQPTPSDGRRAPVARPRPSLKGDLITAKLLVTPDGLDARDLSIRGNVVVRHQVRTGESMMPIELVGDTLRLQRSATQQGGGRDYLQLGSGPESPARFLMGDGYFVGPTIKVWPHDNVVQVDGAGELQVPRQVLASAGKPRSEDVTKKPSIQWQVPPHCQWLGSMQFDGQTALLDGGVKIDATIASGESPWITTMAGQAMEIALDRSIELLDQASMKAATVAQISLFRSDQQPVTVRSEQRAADQAPEAIHLLTADRLSFMPADGGKLLGTGPGSYRGWMMTDRNSSILSPRASETEHLGNQVLQGVHLKFRNALEGDLTNRTLAFTGGVRAGVRKLNGWDEHVDVDQMQRLAMDESTLQCERLQFGITPGIPEDVRNIPGMPTPWEMEASGGVLVRARTDRGLIEGDASRASYASRKSWLLIEGSPAQSASFKQTTPEGKPGFQMRYPQMALNLKTYELEFLMEDAKIGNLPQPPRR
ncbi:hypothetical protein FYK55_11530 [Roseiconus nitratireducens]|uniref:OstA-like protein n=1 Tax=Roseiconus nitratireducens TaxID=2605748 RepID=A0A5M6D8B8_9BACT|nr:hypothetical protein [Roseiconus nitratireducens]KAA5543798.1 hypothetical protein FYK55_11530 [Roseiconus nitratireducens]